MSEQDMDFVIRDLSITDACHHLDIVLPTDDSYQSLAPSVWEKAPRRYLFIPAIRRGSAEKSFYGGCEARTEVF
ncbi:hypothetical protein BSR04_22530 [Serratia plymuthica]|nr:hypothetical protein BSR04_22530 [Serratia plymuthica]